MQFLSASRRCPPPKKKEPPSSLSRSVFRGVQYVSIGEGVRVYGNALDHRRVDRAVFIPLLRRRLPLHRQSFHLIEDVPPVEDPSEYRVNVVQVRLSLVREEELHTASSYKGS